MNIERKDFHCSRNRNKLDKVNILTDSFCAYVKSGKAKEKRVRERDGVSKQ